LKVSLLLLNDVTRCRLRDDTRQRDVVLKHLAEENRKAAEVVTSLESLQQKFEFDIASRVPDVETRPCVRKGDNVYYQSRQEGDQYWRILRKAVPSPAMKEPGVPPVGVL
jgi:protease II